MNDDFTGRFVRPGSGNYLSGYTQSGFLHRWPEDASDRDRAGQWHVTPGWEHLCLLATCLPAQITFDPVQGILYRNAPHALYVWGDDPQRTCTPYCPACALKEAREPWRPCYTCRLEPGLSRIAPGRHFCIIPIDVARTLLPKQHAAWSQAEEAARQAAQERDRLHNIVDMLERLTAVGR